MVREGPIGPLNGYVLFETMPRRWWQLTARATVTAEWELPAPGQTSLVVANYEARDVAEYATECLKAGRVPVLEDTPMLQVF